MPHQAKQEERGRPPGWKVRRRDGRLAAAGSTGAVRDRRSLDPVLLTVSLLALNILKKFGFSLFLVNEGTRPHLDPRVRSARDSIGQGHGGS